MNRTDRILIIATAFASIATELPAADAAKPGRPVDGIMDNSFLVEEAYNQPEGVVQHIFNAQLGRDLLGGPDVSAWTFTFTQEWPLVSQRHQLSFTMPFSFVDTGALRTSGLNDTLLNYRLQAYYNEESLTAFAPRVSLVLPSGNANRGFGSDTLGLQANLPFSTALSDEWFAHANAGMTWLPNAGPAPRRVLQNYSAAASLIYCPREDFHLLIEGAANWNEGVNAAGRVTRPLSLLVSPGVRKAFNLAGDRQLVLGIAAPIGATRTAPDYGVFLYLSFEHFFKRK
ncbi:MAG: transporter [Verrucomicrobia bacterium]|nr:transporter [Verrucomicrobiota bacterium]